MAMRIAYICHTRFPTEKAHGRQMAEVCSAMGVLGHEVTLLAPTVHTPIKQSASSYYGVPDNVQVKKLQTFDALHSRFVPMPLAFLFGMRSYRKTLGQYLASETFDLLYCRSHAVLPPLLASGAKVIVELHTLPRSKKRAFAWLCNRCERVICLTTPMRDELIKWGVDAAKIIVEGDAVDEKAFMDQKPLISDQPVIGYVGSLVARNTLEKGVAHLVEALALLKKEGVPVRGMIVGGPDDWKKKYEQRAADLSLTEADVIFTGRVAASDVPAMLKTCDVFIYPAPASKHPYFMRDTSPLKIFEYMAAGCPIISADLPTIRDVLDESTALFCKAGDGHDLARAIKETLQDPEAADRRAAAARQKVEEHTWKKRMGRILDHVVQSST
jgi:glycosyltransferase involved in cell wall biosynthesis